MSFIIKKNNITMTRGDTVKVTLEILDSKRQTYIPDKGDVIRFAAKKSYADDKPCIIKNIPFDTLELKLEPEDTKFLDQPSTLVYDIEITMTDGTVDTFINGTIEIVEEVY